MLTVLFTLTFWKRIGWALARTAAAALTPFVPALLAHPTSGSTWLGAVLTLGFILVLTVATKLASLPDETGMPWWVVAFTRALRQFGQMIIAGTLGATILSDVQWGPLLQRSAVAAASTLILAAVDAIPKTILPAPVGVDGVPNISSLPAALLADGLATFVSGGPSSSATNLPATAVSAASPVNLMITQPATVAPASAATTTTPPTQPAAPSA